MPERRQKSKSTAKQQKLSHSALEARREALLKRLERLPATLRSNRGYASARALLGPAYIRASLTARLGVLQTAQFMISVLEMLPPM